MPDPAPPADITEPLSPPARRAGRTGSVTRLCRAIALSPAFSVASIGLLSLTLSAFYFWRCGEPIPDNHDEFSYLLAADTFAHGRLTNPTHPFWEHFETFHVLQQPSNQSKYPPGPGLILALGAVLCGVPIVGAWLTLAAASMATCWMLRAWVPPRWAFLGAFIPVLNTSILRSWGQSYWAGGPLGMLGGALVLGALKRMGSRTSARDSALLGIGLVVLMLSRPYEGLLSAIPIAIVYLAIVVKRVRTDRRLLLPLAAPVSLMLTAGLSWLAFYNWSVTGNPLQLPYMAYESTYTRRPQLGSQLFLFWPRAEARQRTIPSLREGQIIDFSRKEALEYKLTRTRQFFLKLPLILPVLFAGLALRRRWNWLALSVALIVFLGVIGLPMNGRSLYYAPGYAAFVVLVIEGCRQMRAALHRYPRVRRNVCGAFALVFVCHFVIQYLATNRTPSDAYRERDRIARELSQRPRQHLVFVTYAPDHFMMSEWVYNAADIEGAKVVWAHDLGPAKNAALRKHFKDRAVWRIEPDRHPVRLTFVAEPGAVLAAQSPTPPSEPAPHL